MIISIILKAAACALAMVPKFGAAPPIRNAPVRTTCRGGRALHQQRRVGADKDEQGARHECLDDAAARDAGGGYDVSGAEGDVCGRKRVALHVVETVLADEITSKIPETQDTTTNQM